MPDRTCAKVSIRLWKPKSSSSSIRQKTPSRRISFQRFFRFYGKLCGMTGTCAEATRELWQIYHRPVVVIPTHRPRIRKQLPDRIFATESAKWAAIVQDIKQMHATGRPILIGTRSVRASERLSELLTAEDLSHAVLNAVRHAEECRSLPRPDSRGASQWLPTWRGAALTSNSAVESQSWAVCTSLPRSGMNPAAWIAAIRSRRPPRRSGKCPSLYVSGR